VRIPAGLAWWESVPGGREWLAALPGLVAACAADWELELDDPYEPASISWVAPARRRDGVAAVLKVSFPDAESEHEAAALRWWGGDGAARLVASDDDRRALLLARCEPGTQLWSVVDDEAATRIAAGVFRRLWKPAEPGLPFRLLATEAARWADELLPRWERSGRPVERRVVEEGAWLCRELAASQPQPVVCHQDLHGGNVLRDGDRWLAIDPKPLLGEPAFDLASLVRDRRGELARAARPVEVVRRRLDVLSEELGVERERARGWAIVHALAWGLGEEEVVKDIAAVAELISGSTGGGGRGAAARRTGG
jgi:streptomycin 6-kinase